MGLHLMYGDGDRQVQCLKYERESVECNGRGLEILDSHSHLFIKQAHCQASRLGKRVAIPAIDTIAISNCYAVLPISFCTMLQRQEYGQLIGSSHVQPLHKITQHPPLSPFSNVNRAARVAASKTSSTPSPVRDEHSRYLRAPISRAAVLPSFSVRNLCDFLRISSCAIGSSRRSFLSPTRMTGTSGHRSFASSTHCS